MWQYEKTFRHTVVLFTVFVLTAVSLAENNDPHRMSDDVYADPCKAGKYMYVYLYMHMYMYVCLVCMLMRVRVHVRLRV